MRHHVIVKFANGGEVDLHPAEALAHEAARVWLDREFTRLECEPLRASGKVLFADKVLAVAQAAGPAAFADGAWAEQFARAAAGALGKPTIRIDLDSASIGY
jgi:hypothetical protein